MPSQRDKTREFLRTEVKRDEAYVVSEIDELMRRLRFVKDAVLGKMRPHYEGDPPLLSSESGVLDTTRFTAAVVRLYLDLERLNAATAADPTFRLGIVHKQDDEWVYFRGGSGDDSGLRTVDGDEDRSATPDEEA